MMALQVTVMRETIITHEDGHSYDDADSKSQAVIGVVTAGGQDDGKGNNIIYGMQQSLH